MRLSIPLLILAAVLAWPAQCQEITDRPEIIDLFSNINSADVTLSGDVGGSLLRVDLIQSGERLQSKSLSIDGPGTWIVRWDERSFEEGAFEACAELLDGDVVESRRCYSFYYGGRVPVRFDVRDFLADSRGIHLTIYSDDPTIVDIDYMLISGDKALYVSREKGVSIGGGRYSALQLDWEWKQLLDSGEDYFGRVKINELNHDQTRAFMMGFRAMEDASITETYEDEMGASATVMGNSRVPFRGSLRFILSGDEGAIETIEKPTPVLLVGDDETVEVSWNETLDPGIYRLNVLLLGNDGGVIDMRESVIEAEVLASPVNLSLSEPEKSPGLTTIAALTTLGSALFLAVRRRR